MRGRFHITRNSKTYSCKTRHIVYSLLYCIYIAHTLQRVQGTLQNMLNIEHIKKHSNSENYKGKIIKGRWDQAITKGLTSPEECFGYFLFLFCRITSEDSPKLILSPLKEAHRRYSNETTRTRRKPEPNITVRISTQNIPVTYFHLA